ncbi:NAD(P)-binding protein [Periconia macrospinosa]|uniref:NAD(P)-binding protein n=1 Tax=Periconia macrospinosa TaxID=97972 RepID=A0A2V1E6R9_9PLEO|nr:NAD(P)-binding protein [Periconia macrospinosa]
MATFVKNHKSPYPALSPDLPGRSLAGKSVLITGASRGVGKHLVRGFAEAQASRIGIIGKDKTRIETARAEFSAEYPKITFIAYAVDVLDEDAVAAVFQCFGAPDFLVNNAGVFPDDSPFVKQNLKAWFAGFEVNVLGTAIVTQKFLQARQPSAASVVINISSMAAHMRFPLIAWSGYNASKLAQVRVFENLRFEHPDVKFFNVHPGNIESDGFTRSGAAPPPSGMTDGKLAGLFCAWLANEEAAFLTGRFVWAEWDIDELKAKKDEILERDLLLTTIDGFEKGF